MLDISPWSILLLAGIDKTSNQVKTQTGVFTGIMTAFLYVHVESAVPWSNVSCMELSVWIPAFSVQRM